eukprot:5768909-Prymnesium_polylepis.1
MRFQPVPQGSALPKAALPKAALTKAALPGVTLYTPVGTDAFGLETFESHLETVESFSPWVHDYLMATGLKPNIPPLPTNKMYFTNFVVAKMSFWDRREVRDFLDAVNASGGIYTHRWGDAPIQTAALRLHAAPTAVVHLDVDYLHMSTRNRIVNGEEVPFFAHGIANAHFRRLAENVTANISGNGSNASNASNTDASRTQDLPAACTGVEASRPGCAPTRAPPAPPAVPPMPPMVPGPSGFKTVLFTSQLRAEINSAPALYPNHSVALYLTPGTVFQLDGASIVVRAIHVQLISDGEGATLDAQQLSRVFDVQSGALLQIQGLTLANGYSMSTGGTISVLGGKVIMGATRIINSLAGFQAGAILVDGGGSLRASKSSVLNSISNSMAGAIGVGGGGSHVILDDGCLIRNSYAAYLGGTLGMMGLGRLTLSGGSSFVNSSAGTMNGCVSLNGPSVFVMTDHSSIVNSFSLGAGGAIGMLEGSSLTLANHSTVRNATCLNEFGGAVYCWGGTVKMENQSSIVD